MQYVQIIGGVNSTPQWLPTKYDKTIAMEVLQSAVPNAIGLYFTKGNQEFVVKVAQDVSHPPPDDLNHRRYYCVYEDDEEYEYD